MYHAMSAEQEAKSALNRPLPIPMSRRPGIEPSKVLDGGSSSGGAPSGGSAPTPAAPSQGSGAGPSGGGAGGSAGASSGGGAAAGGVADGLVVAKEAATAGMRTGRSVGAAASQQTDAANQAPPITGVPMPAHVADSVPAQSSGK